VRVVVALGGNALSPPSGDGSVDELRTALRATAEVLAPLVASGVSLVVTHGNGPQVGRILRQQELAAGQVPPMPMDVCGAESQGQLGYLLASALDDALRAAGSGARAVSLVTRVLVDGRDPAFRRPTKPVGPSYERRVAQRIAHETGQVFTIQETGRWRRVVASPRPLRLVEADPLLRLVDAGCVVVAAGGGGVPVVEHRRRLRGVEAVVDKDRTAVLLARAVGADRLLVLTEVDRVQRGFGTPAAEPLTSLTVSEARRLLASGELPEGSMGPKVEACADFVDGGGAGAAIGSLRQAARVLSGDAGTAVVPG
jgi:carbamate kinase